ncbi:MAG: YjgP/YjgQ family permease [Bacteroidetes bacterium]|nr:YjgP/YjgQ family permease [Bacteroidota bacterium]
MAVNRTLVRRVDLLVLRSYIGPFVVTFVLSMFLFLMQFLWKYIDELVGKGIEPLILMKLIFYSLADLVPMALPLTVMVAGLMTFGNLSESFELVALKANGISLFRILRPVFLLMLGLAMLNFFFMNIVIPKANLEAKALLWDLRQKKPAFNIQEGVFYQQIDGFSMRIGKKHADNESVEDVLIYEYKGDESKRLNVIRAEKGSMVLSPDKRTLFFTLFNGVRYDEMTKNPDYSRTAPFNQMRFEKQKMIIDLSSLDLKFTERDAYKGDYRLMNIRELGCELDTAAQKIQKQKKENATFLARYLHLPDILGNISKPESNKIRPSKMRLLMPRHEEKPKSDQGNVIAGAINNARGFKGTLDGLISGLKYEEEQLAPYKVEWHKKFTLSVLLIMLFLISAPLGAIIRKGGIGMPLVISVLLFVLFYAINLVGEKIGKEGVLPIWAGMWMSSAILFPIGVYITIKAASDSAILSLEAYQKFFNRLFWVSAKNGNGEEESKVKKELRLLAFLKKTKS